MVTTSSRDRLPYDLEAEKCVLGSMLRDPQCASDVFAEVRQEDFYLPRHRFLFGLLEALDHRSAGACDPVTVAHEMERTGCAEECGGRAYLEDLMRSVPSLAFLENHLRIVRDLALRRALLDAAERIQHDSLQGAADVRELVDAAEQIVFRVGDRLVQQQLRSARDLVAQNLDLILSSAGPEGLRTGYLDLDELHGFRPGDFVVLAARPSMGKTALALNILERVALRGEKAALFFSLEMPGEQILLRLLSSLSGVRHEALRRGRLGAAERSKLTVAAGELRNARLYIDDTSQPTLAEMRAKARRLRRERNLDLVVVDYLQLLGVPRAASREQEIAIISRNMKSIARDLGVPVLALAQLNREAEKREGSRPRLSDLRESGSIEQDADLVLLLYREEYYVKDSPNAGLAELIVAKNRHGPTRDVLLRFDKEHMRFENFTRAEAAVREAAPF